MASGSEEQDDILLIAFCLETMKQLALPSDRLYGILFFSENYKNFRKLTLIQSYKLSI